MSHEHGEDRVQVVDQLQQTIEDLAQRLGRSVAVDDPALRLIACSSHFGDADPARLDSLVGRRVEGVMRDFVMSSGISQWRGPGRIPARPDLGTERDRVGFPLRTRYELLGFMWILDDGSISEEEMRLAAETARDVEEILARRLMLQKDTDAEQESAVLGLLSAARDDRAGAARDLLDSGFFPRSTGFAVVALQSGASSTGAEHPDRELVRHAIRRATMARPRTSVASAVSGPNSLVVVGGLHNQSDLRELATALHRELATADPGPGQQITVGVGSTRAQLADAAVSYDQAVTAAGVAARRGRPIGVWGEDPTELLLEVVCRPSWDAHLVPEVLTTLDETQPPPTLDVVQSFLDHAGNALATAEALHSHRSTVYYHLGKFQTSTGLDLDDGGTRLMLQLWFRISRRTPSR
jgi:PucR C-terminal helix-turn-helix domain/GGDEF-like domain